MNKFRKPHGSGPRNGGRFGGRGPSRPSFGASSYPRSGEPRREVAEKFDAICSNCGKPCQVPFRPNGVKPVYCRDCFGSPQQASPGRTSFPSRNAPTRSFEPQTGTKSIADLERQIGAMNTKIDTMLRILESMPRSTASAGSDVLPIPSRVDPDEAAPRYVPRKKPVRRSGPPKR